MTYNLFIGTDIVDVSRINALIQDHPERFIKRTYTPKEQSYCKNKANPAIHYSGRFAAKEAIKKALMSFGMPATIPWTDMEIIADKNGAPIVSLHSKKLKLFTCKVSISHTEKTAVAFAIIIKK